jgi:hypothetical protein
MTRRDESSKRGQDDGDDLPESGMGGASDSGAHGGHPASALGLTREHRSPLPERAPGDAPIERRRRAQPDYAGPERRIGRT